MVKLLVFTMVLLTGCATTPPPAAPFERCMKAIGAQQYGSERINAATWCRANNNGDIQ
jgi:predicted component of type VI protein secretion system